MVNEVDCQPRCKFTTEKCHNGCPSDEECIQTFVDCKKCFVATCTKIQMLNPNLNSNKVNEQSNSTAIIGGICGGIALVFLIVMGYLTFRYMKFKKIQEQSSISRTALAKRKEEEDEKLFGIQSIFTQTDASELNNTFSNQGFLPTNSGFQTGFSTSLSTQSSTLGSLASPIDQPVIAKKARASVTTSTRLARLQSDQVDQPITNQVYKSMDEPFIMEPTFEMNITPTKFHMNKKDDIY